MKMRLLRTLIIWSVFFGGIYAYFHWKKSDQLDRGVVTISPDGTEDTAAAIIKRPSRSTATDTAGASEIGGAFEMVDQNGQAVTDKTYADSYKLVFFGFTYCPAICPTELQKVNVIMNELGEEAQGITPIFVTVDPERDTVEVMKQYVEQFHPRLVGLTGSMDQVEAIKQTFRVYASKVENEMMEEYMMDHSAFLYLMDKDNKMIALYPSKDTAVEIAKDIQSRNLAL